MDYTNGRVHVTSVAKVWLMSLTRIYIWEGSLIQPVKQNLFGISRQSTRTKRRGLPY